MKWVKIANNFPMSLEIFGRVDDDGLMRVTAVAEHPEFVAWVAEGNIPEPWNPGE